MRRLRRRRQRGHHLRVAEALHRRADTSQRWNSRPDEGRAYPDKSLSLAAKAEGSLGAGCPGQAPEDILRLIGHVRRFAGRIDRRALRKEAIPHAEKVFPIFEEHTRWIAKGKAGKPAELGVPVVHRRGRRRVRARPRDHVEGRAVRRREGARGGCGLRGCAAQALRRRIGDQRLGAPRPRPGAAARPGRVRAGGRPVHPRRQAPAGLLRSIRIRTNNEKRKVLCQTLTNHDAH